MRVCDLELMVARTLALITSQPSTMQITLAHAFWQVIVIALMLRPYAEYARV